MSADDDAAVTLLRRMVPEFEPVYAREMLDDDGEMESFAAVSHFADFVLESMAGSETNVVHRAFLAVEALAALDSRWFPLASSLAVEILECVWDDDNAVAAMGPVTRSRLANLRR